MMKMPKKKRRLKKKNAAVWILLILVIVLVAACGREKEPEETQDTPEEGGIRLYYLNEERTKLISSSYEVKGKTTWAQIAYMLADLKDILWTEEELENLAEKEPIIGFEIKSEGLLSLKFAADYGTVHTTTAVLRRAALVKSLCQLEGVSAVEIYIGAQPLMYTGGKPVGMMKPESFVDSTGENTEFYQEETITLYVPDESGQKLKSLTLRVTYDGTLPTERLVMEQLIKEPITDGVQRTVPEGTVLNKISVKNGICYVDFNEKFLEKQDSVSAEATLYSIVNSLAELSGIHKVQFSINGETKKIYQNIDLSVLFERNLDIVEGEQ